MADPAQQVPPSPDAIAQMFKGYNGPFLVAVQIGYLLYGFYLAQLNTYFNDHAASDAWYKWLVIAVTCMCGLHLGFGTGASWGVLVEGWGNPVVWQKTPWEASMLPFTTGLTAFLVQTFFAGRIVLIQRDLVGKALAAVVALIALLALAGALGQMIEFLTAGSNALDIAHLQLITRIWTISSVACDVLIAVIMIGILARTRQRTVFRSTRDTIKRLIFQSIETGTVTAVFMVLLLVCYETMQKENTTYLVWEYSLPPLYGNVMLFVLNARQSFRKDNIKYDTSMGGTPTIGGSGRSQPAVKVDTDVVARYDLDLESNNLGRDGYADSKNIPMHSM
ncbi:hypothetical protein EV122DRAFT_276920 [Schizophyllum commune]